MSFRLICNRFSCDYFVCGQLDLPASRRTAAAAAAAAKAAASATTAAVIATAEEEQEYQAREEAAEQQVIYQQEGEDRQTKINVVHNGNIIICAISRFFRSSGVFYAAELNAFAFSDGGCCNGIALDDTLAVVVLLEVRQHIIVLDAACFAIRQYAL